MTDERPDRDPSQPDRPPESSQQQPPTPADEHDEAEILEGAGDFTSGEGLVAFAGIVLLLIWVIFDVFFDEYPISSLILLVAVTAVLVPRLDPEMVQKVLPVATVMKVAGYALAILGVITIIGDIEASALEGAGRIIAALISYAAFAMAFMGARQVDI